MAITKQQPRRNYGFVPVRQRIQNASVTGYSGGMDVSDRGFGSFIPLTNDNPYSSTDFIYRWRQYVAMYEMSWEARKIIRIPVEDALRKGWQATGIPEDAASSIQNRLDHLQFLPALKRSLILERLLGGSLTFIGLEDVVDDPSREYHPRMGARTHFFNAIPISRIARASWCTDPLSIHYMRPESYLINGVEVHTSRCLVWDGEPLFDPNDFALNTFRSNIQGFGPSKLAPIWDDIVKAIGTRQAAYQLIQTNNAIIAAISDLQDLLGTTKGKTTVQRIKDIANQLSLYRAALIDGEKVEFSQHSASFGSVPELLLTYLQVLSAASDIPATRFLGQAPGGLNATGESDLENYYNNIDAYQSQRIKPQLFRIYDIIGYNMFPSWDQMRKDLDFGFPPMWNETELEQAQRNQITIDNVLKLLDGRILPEDLAIEELNLKGVLSVTLDAEDLAILDDTGTEEDTPPTGDPSQFGQSHQEVVSNSIAALFQTHNKRSDWDEDSHPRAKDGKFGSGGGGIAKAKQVETKAEAKSDGKKSSDKPDAKPTAKGTGPVDAKPSTSKKPPESGEDKSAPQKKQKPQPVEHTPEDKAAHALAKSRGLKVPPAWTNVWVNPDPEAGLQVKGKDAKGNWQPIYSVTHTNASSAKKFNRIKDFQSKVPEIKSQILKDLDTKPEADVLNLISETGFRIGGTKNTGAAVQAYGASTLLVDHVKVSDGKVSFDFIGKKGVRQQHVVESKSIVDSVKKAMAGKKNGDRLFNTTPDKVRAYLHELAPGYLVKDFRTYVATAEAQKIVSSMGLPTDEKDYQKKVLDVCTQVSRKLGNAPSMAKKSYIDPTVWAAWEAKWTGPK